MDGNAKQVVNTINADIFQFLRVNIYNYKYIDSLSSVGFALTRTTDKFIV